MGVDPGLTGATRGCMPVRGDWMGETGEDDSSEDESETDSARPRRVLMGMGLLCGTLVLELADIVVVRARGK